LERKTITGNKTPSEKNNKLWNVRIRRRNPQNTNQKPQKGRYVKGTTEYGADPWIWRKEGVLTVLNYNSVRESRHARSAQKKSRRKRREQGSDATCVEGAKVKATVHSREENLTRQKSLADVYKKQ